MAKTAFIKNKTVMAILNWIDFSLKLDISVKKNTIMKTKMSK